MKINFQLFIFFLLPSILFAQLETEDYKSNLFIKQIDSNNNKLVIFLHGGLRDPYLKQNKDSIKLKYLIENNLIINDFAKEYGFDILFPVSNDSLNWLNQPEKSFKIILDYINISKKKYDAIYIGGFSDGGTGSFKIFNQHLNYFDGLVVFNGYPQHNNFYLNTNYQDISNKKIIFISTKKDKVIPYEFLYSEFEKIKKHNNSTYFFLLKGGHTFENYDETLFATIFEVLTKEKIFRSIITPSNEIKIRKRILKKYGVL